MPDMEDEERMTEPTEKTVTFEVTLTVSDPALLRAAALQHWLTRRRQREGFYLERTV